STVCLLHLGAVGAAEDPGLAGGEGGGGSPTLDLDRGVGGDLGAEADVFALHRDIDPALVVVDAEVQPAELGIEVGLESEYAVCGRLHSRIAALEQVDGARHRPEVDPFLGG